MDAMAAERLAEQLPASETIIHTSYELDDLFDVYAKAGLIITNRLHASIFSILSDRPVLVVDDGTHKIATIAKLFEIASVDAKAVLTPEDADLLVQQAINYDYGQRVIQRQRLAEGASRNMV
jgi:exopolysaccharide biosynthesis predicted pyruvyltransferase EpsI